MFSPSLHDALPISSELSLAPKQRPAHENIEFQIIVRNIAFCRLRYAAFATAITAAEHDRLQNIVGHNALHVFSERYAPTLEPLLEFLAAIDCEALRHFKAGHISSVSFKYA